MGGFLVVMHIIAEDATQNSGSFLNATRQVSTYGTASWPYCTCTTVAIHCCTSLGAIYCPRQPPWICIDLSICHLGLHCTFRVFVRYCDGVPLTHGTIHLR